MENISDFKNDGVEEKQIFSNDGYSDIEEVVTDEEPIQEEEEASNEENIIERMEEIPQEVAVETSDKDCLEYDKNSDDEQV
ncbi:hypothetical protein QYM36_000040 [Artemia franciscana]|uniref:Uncharacterized protein n=1 Tax=Artemia franciscana TaxID=6661 RepID=A0AA88IBR8_ARTSF|nr:hypothetical protein QYM36_000040 [Artemia franciscana]